MIFPQDATLLAITKLKTRKLRLIVTVVIAGLLFVLLTVVSLVMNGALRSVESFSEEGLGKRYVVRVDSIGIDELSAVTNPETIAEIQARYEAIEKQKVTRAKELGIEYTTNPENSPVIKGGGPDGGDYVTDVTSPASQPVLERVQKEELESYFARVSEVEVQYGATQRYNSVSLAEFGGGRNGTTITIVRNGIEEIEQEGANGESFGIPKGLDSIKYGLTAFSDELMAPFLLEGQSLDVKDDIIPVVVPFSAAEEILGIQTLPASASSEQRVQRIKEVRSSIASQKFSVCLRNQASVSRLQDAARHQRELELNAQDSKKYPKPDLVYQRSDAPCEDVVVARDARTSSEKKEAEKYMQFEREFGAEAPGQRMVQFVVVGVAPDPPTFENFRIVDVLNTFLASSLGGGWLIPLSVQEQLPEYSDAFEKKGNIATYSVGDYLEFETASQARTFIEEQSCEPQFFIEGAGQNFNQICSELDRPYFLSPFGGSSIALESFRSGFASVFYKALIVIAVISAFIMMGTVGKVISDSRRETAVFRAIGAKRFDIAQIYLTYAMFIGVIIASFAVVLGWLLALSVHDRYSDDFTVEALVSFGANDLNKTFSLIGFESNQLLILFGVIVLGSMLSAVLPLLTNLRRSPIRDMRDER